LKNLQYKNNKRHNRKNVSVFVKLRKKDKNGNEYWSAKELSKLLGYPK